MTRTSTTLLLVLALVSPLAGCGGDPSIETARGAWRTTKTACDGAYHYTIPYTSSTGAVTVTKVEITDDHATVRRFSGSPSDPNPVTWTETGADVGTHAQGWQASTMEQLYDTCESDVLSRKSQDQIVFKADARGVLEECSFVSSSCAADCSGGFRVTDFACGPLPTP